LASIQIKLGNVIKNMTKVDQILKKLTPERIEAEIKSIQKIELPLELQKWVKEYEKVGDRDGFIWKWAYKVAQIITFPGVPQKYCKFLWEIKFLIILFIVMLDDVADKMKNKKLLQEIEKIFYSGKINPRELNLNEKKYLNFTLKIWSSLATKIQKCPNARKFYPIIEYDFRQVLNGIRYAFLITQTPEIVNTIEPRIYLSSNTPAILSYMVDLSCLLEFDFKNVGAVRKLGWYGQLMTRIANTISTWRREINENDFTNEMLANALENNLVNSQDLIKRKKKNIEGKVEKSNIEKQLLTQWEDYYVQVKKLFKKNKYINSKKITKVFEELMIVHLISKGLI